MTRTSKITLWSSVILLPVSFWIALRWHPIGLRGMFALFSVVCLLAALGASPIRSDGIPVHPALHGVKMQRVAMLIAFAFVLALLAVAYR